MLKINKDFKPVKKDESDFFEKDLSYFIDKLSEATKIPKKYFTNI